MSNDGTFDIDVNTQEKNGWGRDYFCVKCESKSQVATWDGISLR
jgi:hypothetical protein